MGAVKRTGRTKKYSMMSRQEFRRLRLQMGFSQSELARELGYGHALRISELERETNPVRIPWAIGALLIAMDRFGYRPLSGDVNDPFA